jgi:hypothetical protein
MSTQTRRTDGTSVAFRGLADAANRALQRAEADGTGTWLHLARADFWDAMAEPNKATLKAKLNKLSKTCDDWVRDLDTRA